MDVIQIENLTRDYGGGRGIFNINFAVQQGEVFGFLGPNGAGKTTTIRHLMGFLIPKAGSCTINGKGCWRESAAIQKDIGYLPGEITLPNDMTGEGFLKFYAKYRGMKDTKLKEKLMRRFELDASKSIKKMSKGMKQKLGIVAAFMHDPKVLVLDEPTSGLDPLMQNMFIDMVIEEKKRGKTFLMSSHMFEEVERTCERVGIIRSGRMVAVEQMDTLKAAQVKQYVITFKNEQEAQKFAEEDVRVKSVEGAKVSVYVQNNIRRLIDIMQRFDVQNLEAPNQSLEEIFLHYYGGESA